MLVALMEPDLRVHFERSRLICNRDGQALRVLPFHQMDALHLHGSATLSASARRLLLRQGVDVVFLDAAGRFLGRLVGPERAGAERRLEQYRTCSEVARALDLARDIVAGKLRNQRQVLMARRIGAGSAAIRGLDQALARVQEAATLDEVRGSEGWGARSYFEGFSSCIQAPGMEMRGRTRRPPRDPVNAMLSYAYTLLVARVESAVRCTALDPYLGVLHVAGRGAPAMALDLAEEWRPWVDRLVLRLVNRKQLTPEDFRRPVEVDDDEAVWLDKTGRTILTRAFERELRERMRHPVTGERWPVLALLRQQAQQMATAVALREPAYLPVELAGR